MADSQTNSTRDLQLADSKRVARAADWEAGDLADLEPEAQSWCQDSPDIVSPADQILSEGGFPVTGLTLVHMIRQMAGPRAPR